MARSALVAYVVLLCGAMPKVSMFSEEVPCETDTPVCGNDGKTYKNMCHLYMAQYEDHHLLLFHKGRCDIKLPYKKRNITAPKKLESPLLESRLKTKIKSSLELLLHGKQYCPRKLEPVCGSDGRTYATKCHLLYQTLLDNNLDMLDAGQCQTGQNKDRKPKRTRLNRSAKRFMKRMIGISG